jgi:BirA family biotin operon repressor/biotin-[acetyl-CoA-carboxylase] ligase
VALRPEDFPPELKDSAATLGLDPEAIEPVLAKLLAALERWLSAPADQVLEAVRARDALYGHAVRWSEGEGRADGIDTEGRLLVQTAAGRRVALDAGEIHLLAQKER